MLLTKVLLFASIGLGYAVNDEGYGAAVTGPVIDQYGRPKSGKGACRRKPTTLPSIGASKAVPVRLIAPYFKLGNS